MVWGLALTMGAWGAPSAAQVRLEVLPDGTRMMHNEGAPRAFRRPAAVALAVDRSPEIHRLIDRYALRRSLDPELVRAVIQVESGFRTRALSIKGAMGLMQLMPGTAAVMGASDPYDPEQNVRAGTGYLRLMLDQFGGDLDLALAGYNAGPEAVERYGGIPPYDETRGFVEKVIRIYREDPGYALPPGPAVVGRRTYLERDAEGRLVMTTTPTGGR